MLHDWLTQISGIITKRHVFGALSASLILLIGLYFARRAADAVMRVSQLDAQQRLMFRKLIYYGMVTVVCAAALNQLGFDLKVLLGAAGVLTVAVGFAAQTSASNLISGLFLMVERPFIVGDVISVGDIKGEVHSIDLLSCKVRTFDNLMVRVPNETMVKSNITNLSYFPIRRIDINMGVAYKENMSRVKETLMAVAERNPLCLEEPAPLFVFKGFGESSLDIQFSVWTTSANLGELQNRILEEIKAAFDAASIEMPYPHRVLLFAGEPPPQARA